MNQIHHRYALNMPTADETMCLPLFDRRRYHTLLSKLLSKAPKNEIDFAKAEEDLAKAEAGIAEVQAAVQEGGGYDNKEFLKLVTMVEGMLNG